MSRQEATKHEIVNDDTVFVGTAVEIVLQMREQTYFERGVPMEFYLDQLVNIIKLFGDEVVTLTGETIEEKAESFIQELLRIGYFKEA